MQTTVEKNIEATITPALEALGYGIVRVKIIDGNKRSTLQILLERADGSGIGLEDCKEINRHVSALLDVEDPIKDRYDLEISSPGLDRPLTRKEDFTRFAGRQAKIVAAEAIEGRKKFQGTLVGLDEEDITMKVLEGSEQQTVTIPFAKLASAKLVITDDIFKKVQQH